MDIEQIKELIDYAANALFWKAMRLAAIAFFIYFILYASAWWEEHKGDKK